MGTGVVVRRLPPKIAAALAKAGAVLVRQKKHLVFRLPSGQSVTVAASPSDHRAERNIVTDVRKASGEARAVAAVRPRHTREKPGRSEPAPFSGLRPMEAALVKSGVIERRLQQQLDEATDRERLLRWRVFELEDKLIVTRAALITLEQSRSVRLIRTVQRWIRRCRPER